MSPGAGPGPKVPTDIAAALHGVRAAVGTVIRGKDDVIAHAVVTLVAGGHLLLEDLPGVGKSTLARSLATAIGGTLSRVQFTSDLLPADIVGFNVWRASEERFEFRRGPIFANFVLADEINRAPPRTQSALLEGMGEGTVSVDGTSHVLARPFMVLATQNPLEHHGTYPLPESQRDRFTLRLSLGYASDDVEAALLADPRSATPPPLQTMLSCEDVAQAQRSAAEVFVHADLATYAQRIVAATRSHPGLRLGVSTRGALAWVRAARARAWLDKRSQITIDDLQLLANPALAHRLVVSKSGDAQGHAATDIIQELVATLAVPR